LSTSLTLSLSACHPTNKFSTTPAQALDKKKPMTLSTNLTAIDKDMRAQDSFLVMLTEHGCHKTSSQQIDFDMGYSNFYMITPQKN
jgi:hypothetical protein